LCKTKPIVQNEPNFRVGTACPSCRLPAVLQNEPNLPGGTGPEGRGARGQCAKRTQFGTRCPEMGAGRLAGDLQRGPIRQNEPNFAAVPGGTGPWAIMRNKANSRQGSSKGKYFMRKRLWRIKYADGLGETKPICGSRAGTMRGTHPTKKRLTASLPTRGRSGRPPLPAYSLTRSSVCGSRPFQAFRSTRGLFQACGGTNPRNGCRRACFRVIASSTVPKARRGVSKPRKTRSAEPSNRIPGGLPAAPFWITMLGPMKTSTGATATA
jgi:hypothetical protein